MKKNTLDNIIILENERWEIIMIIIEKDYRYKYCKWLLESSPPRTCHNTYHTSSRAHAHLYIKEESQKVYRTFCEYRNKMYMLYIENEDNYYLRDLFRYVIFYTWRMRPNHLQYPTMYSVNSINSSIMIILILSWK